MNKGIVQPAHPSSSLTEPPSDLELMQYFDGELEEPRRSVVAALAGADQRARGKLAGMRVTSAIVQSQARSLTVADNIADLVMAKISAGSAAPALAASVLPFPQAGLRPAGAANDNARRIFGVIAAIAVAAAAGLALWSRLGTEPAAPAHNAPIAVHTAPAALPSPKSAEPEVDAAMVAPEGDSEHGVEVAAVNFGAHTGSIFFVPSGSIEAKRTTTVVWLADDGGE